MLSLEDPRWGTLAGGYRVPYDPTPALRRLTVDWHDATAWEALWGDLHHQGDVGEASYAALAALVAIGRGLPARGWNFYALAAVIESERHARRNPSVPGWLESDYARAWKELLTLALDELRGTDDPLVVQSSLAVIALAKGSTKLGVLIGNLDRSELAEILEDAMAWSEHYRDDLPSPDMVPRPAAVRRGAGWSERSSDDGNQGVP